MSRKDYVAIAEAIARLRDNYTDPTVRSSFALVALELADALAADNPRFDRDRFLVACHVTG